MLNFLLSHIFVTLNLDDVMKIPLTDLFCYAAPTISITLRAPENHQSPVQSRRRKKMQQMCFKMNLLDLFRYNAMVVMDLLVSICINTFNSLEH